MLCRAVLALTHLALLRRSPKRLRVFLQVNTSAEDQKGGVAPEDAPRIAAAIAAMPNLHLAGLMTIGKFGDVSPKYFETL